MNNLTIFENFEVKRHFNEKTGKWYFSVIDIIAVLLEEKGYKKAKSYWSALKARLKKEGSEVVTNCDQLKIKEVFLIIMVFIYLFSIKNT